MSIQNGDGPGGGGGAAADAATAGAGRGGAGCGDVVDGGAAAGAPASAGGSPVDGPIVSEGGVSGSAVGGRPNPADFVTGFHHALEVGAVLARFKGAPPVLPGYVAIPEVAVRSSTAGEFKRARTPLRGWTP